MITDEIKSIVEAEDASAAEIKQAECRRTEIIAQAEAHADAVRKSGAERARGYLAEQSDKTQAQVKLAADAKQNEFCRKIDEEIDKIDIDPAVELVLNKLI